MSNAPINPMGGDRYALEGKVVTMNSDRMILERGVVYIQDGNIQAVQPFGSDPPQGFEDAPVVHTGGTIFPGLIELHNHLSYNILPLWNVPKRFNRRDEWRDDKDKQKLITGPMQVLGKTPGYVEAIVRFVECKCVVSGVTTSQGLKLYGVGVNDYYRGVVRNVESPLDPALPRAETRIADVDASGAAKFLARLNKEDCFLLHLCEGLDDKTREHFEALQLPDGSWAINENLAGIHCAALTPEQFQIYANHMGAMVWSPLSNLLLYGDTAKIKAAKDAGVLIGIGSDWSPSGSKNLLCEMKVADLFSQANGDIFTKDEIVAMATINAARILKWDQALGSIETGKRADFLVVDDRQGDPYERLLNARESSISLVVINGVPRYGQTTLMDQFGPGTEQLAVGTANRVLNLLDPAGDPLVADLTLQAAIDRLQDGLNRLPELALALEDPDNPIAWLADLGMTFESPDQALSRLSEVALASGSDALAGVSADQFAGPIAFLELDKEELRGESIRPHLPHPVSGVLTGFPAPPPVAVLYSEVLKDVQIDLDGLTVIGDPTYFPRLAAQINLPEYLKTGLPKYYGQEPPLPESAAPFRNLSPAVRPQFATTMLLSDFLRTGGYLSKADRQRIIEQALVLIEKLYVHMPFKRAMYAVDPIQRLRLLQYHLEQQDEATLSSEIEFHNELTGIFTSLRDLHTNYLLPSPYREKTAFLPFVIEEYEQDGQAVYIVSKVIGDVEDPNFVAGVEVLYWNGTPIRRAVEQNAERQAGGNLAARYARGLDALTIRPLVRMQPPGEEWVTLRYLDLDQNIREIEQKWLVFSPYSGPTGLDQQDEVIEAAALGFDMQTNAIHQVRKIFFAADAIQAERDISAGKIRRAAARPDKDLPTSMPTVFRARAVNTSYADFAYIRIFTFMVDDADAFVNEFVRLVSQLPQNGLIIDVRGNGGGLIYAAERLLQVLTPLQVEPERAQFINSPLTLEICRQHNPSKLWDGFSLGPWVDSIRQSVETGAAYSRAFPITTPESIHAFSQVYYGPKVLITDALCYSATDMFAAGFQDHQIGVVLGTSSNTGAGGANVWSHTTLSQLLSEPTPPYPPLPSSPFKPLPSGAGMMVAIRRTLRAGPLAGTPLEDLGVHPDDEHRMTERDLLEGNQDLIEKAGEILASLPCYTLEVQTRLDQTGLNLQIFTENLDRLDMFFDDRIMESFDVQDGSTELSFDLPTPSEIQSALRLRLDGYAAGKLVAGKVIEVD